MKTGIVYYSRSNNTRTGAQYLARQIGAELIELEERKGRRGPIGFVKSGFEAVTNRASQLVGEPWKKLSEFDHIYLMTPIWASHATPAVNALLKQADFSGKKVTVITLQADAKLAESERVHSYVQGLVEQSGGVLAGSYALHSAMPGKSAGKEHIEAQLDSVLAKGEAGD